MADRWYRQPETFIALSALVVSLSAVVVGVYEATLQREHDRAEVWPNVELAVFTRPNGAVLYLDNTGIGPAIVKQVVVTLDGRPVPNWSEAINGLVGREVHFSRTTVLNHGLRAGDRVTLIELPNDAMPSPFWDSIARIGMTVCYASVFGESWTLSAAHVGQLLVWRQTDHCGPQPSNTQF
jgi:hypothetical protein